MTIAEIVQAVTGFVTANIELVTAAVVVGLMGSLLARLIRSGR